MKERLKEKLNFIETQQNEENFYWYCLAYSYIWRQSMDIAKTNWSIMKKVLGVIGLFIVAWMIWTVIGVGVAMLIKG
jgi:hypothetical protein